MWMTSKQILMSRKVASQDKIGQPKDRSGNAMVLAPLAMSSVTVREVDNKFQVNWEW